MSSTQFYLRDLRASNLVKRWMKLEFDCLRDCMTLLHYIGLWRVERETPRKLNDFVALVSYFVMVIVFYQALLGFPLLIFLYMREDLQVAVDGTLCTFVAWVTTSFLFSLNFQRDKLELVFEEMEAMKALGSKLPERPDAELKEVKQLSKMFACIALGIVFVITLTTLTSLPILYVQRKFFYRCWFPFNETESPVYEFVLVLEAMCNYQSLTAICLMIPLFGAFLLEASAQFRILAHNLRNIRQKFKPDINIALVGWSGRADTFYQAPSTDRHIGARFTRQEYKGKKEAEELLHVCVKHHNSIIRYIETAQSAYRTSIFLFSLCVLVACGIGTAQFFFMTDAVDTKAITYVVLIVGANISAALGYWVCNNITTENEAVREAVYSCDWFGQTECFKRGMRIMISRCNQPFVITDGGFFPYTLEAYTNIPRMAYTFCMAAWTLMKN